MTKYVGNYFGNPGAPFGGDTKGVWNIYHQFKYRVEGIWSANIAGGGGDIVSGKIPGNGYVYHTFSSPGTFSINATPTIGLQVLIVASGGSGGNSVTGNGGGGGGGGGIAFIPVLPLPSAAHSITVSVGSSVGGVTYGSSGNNGNDSSIVYPGPVGPVTVTAKGGGGGGYYNVNGSSGGSGGGGGGFDRTGGPATQPTQNPGNPLVLNYGTAGGGSGPGNPGNGGGGGGAGGAGGPANVGGAGQAFPGFEYSLCFPSVYTPLFATPINTLAGFNPSPTFNHYGGGGAGENYTPTATVLGGAGGGGNSGPIEIISPGGRFLGGGGAGAQFPSSLSGGGGSGIVIFRYIGG